MSNNIINIINELEEKRLFGNKLVDYWLSQDYSLSEDEFFELVKKLSNKEYIFFWLDLLCYFLPMIVKYEGIIEIIHNISSKVKGDLAQGPFINALIEIGEVNPNEAIKLYNKISEKYPEDLEYGGLLLGGSARIDKNTYNFIIDEVINLNGIKCTSYVRAIRVALEKLKEIDNNIFNIFNILVNSKSYAVQREVALAYFDLYDYNQEEMYKQLEKLATSKDKKIRYTISNMLSMRDLNQEHIQGMISILSNDIDNSVLDLVARAIAVKNKEDTEFSLNIIKHWIDSEKYYDIKNIQWVLNEIGNENFAQSIKIVKSWFITKDFRLYLIGPDILWALGQRNVDELTSAFFEWMNENELKQIALEGIRKILSECYKTGRNRDYLVDLIFEKLVEVAESEGIDVDRVTQRYNPPIFKCTSIIEELLIDRPEINYERVQSNLTRFPHLTEFLSLNWFHRKIEERETDHPLIIHLSKDLESETYFNSFLSYLDSNVALLENQESQIGTLRRGLRDTLLFWSTMSELDAITKIRRHYRVIIEPLIELEQNGRLLKRRPDLRVRIDSNDILIEVITPDMFAPLKFFRMAVGIPNRLGSKIYTEFQEHFQGQIVEEDVIIMVDISHSELDYYAAESYLGGSFQVTMKVDRSTGRVIDTFPSRADDAMHILDPDTKSIIGLVLYRRVIGTDGQIHLSGRIFTNESVMNDERRRILTAIKSAFLG